ncbi:MAG: NADH dehydrogenase (quinone) subunit D [Deltaproteobacteria bacterium]|nr:MAG: NADH dehydrogenase (quinone) subunit D [Deltaproteobacteria bacterium]
MEGELSQLETKTLNLNLGPSHPATHGTLRIIVDLDGETIVKADLEIGYLHRGIEKLGENRTYHQFIPLTDRLNYVSCLMNNVGYSLAVEKLLGLEVPPRAQFIRVILCELSRIADHLVCIGTNALDMGGLTNFWYFFKEREYIYDLFEMLTGARMTGSYTRIGGLWEDLPSGFFKTTQEFLKKFPRTVKDVDVLLTRNKIFINRTKGVGAISAEEAIDYGFSGPCLRAAGVEWDLRKTNPYLGYENFDFEIPVGNNGDTYDRYLVRMEEMRQSARIIEQALGNLPEGKINADEPKVVLPEKEKVYNTPEGLIHHFKLITEGFKPPKGEVYSATEAANGELGFYIISDGEASPYRIKIRPPCFAIFQAYSRLVEGSMIADAIAVLGSLNIVAGELDR